MEDTSISDVPEKLGQNTCRFEETSSFMGTVFERGAIFAGTEFEQAGLFAYSEFHEGVSFYGTNFSTGADFNNSEFGGNVSFEKSSLGIAAFLDCKFHKSAIFENATFGNDYTEFLLKADSGQSFSTDTVHKLAVEQKEARENEFVEHYTNKMGNFVAIFNRANIDGRVNLLDVELKGGFLANYAQFNHIETKFHSPLATTTALFHHSDIRGGTFGIEEENCYIELRGATIGDIDISPNDSIDPFDKIYIDSTNFDGFVFSDYREYLRGINWEIDGALVDEEHQPPEKREVTYSKAKTGAAQLGDRLAESKFSILEARYRRDKYRNALRESQDWKNVISNLYRLTTNIAYDFLSKYGESPQRVLGWSIASVVGFSLIYNYALQWRGNDTVSFPLPMSDSQIIYNTESLILSSQSFTSFIVGQSSRELDAPVRLTASFESFIGAFLIALFVATIVRKIER